MVNKNRTKKRQSRIDLEKSPNTEMSLTNGDIDKLNDLITDDAKYLSKELPFASISNKQFKTIGLIPERKPNRQITTIPLKLPLKLMPTLRKIFGLVKGTEKDKVEHLSSSSIGDSSFITLISFERFIQNGQQTKHSHISLPTLQVIQIPISSNVTENKFSLYLSETNIKPESLNSIRKSPVPPDENEKTLSIKPAKKRSFFNDIWRKKSIPSMETVSANIDNKDDLQKLSRPTSPTEVNVNANICLLCGKQAFVAEKIQIGPDVFHNSCFKCYHCSKCLFRGKWNKHQEQYYCDYCYKRTVWPFVRR